MFIGEYERIWGVRETALGPKGPCHDGVSNGEESGEIWDRQPGSRILHPRPLTKFNLEVIFLPIPQPAFCGREPVVATQAQPYPVLSVVIHRQPS